MYLFVCMLIYIYTCVYVYIYIYVCIALSLSPSLPSLSSTSSELFLPFPLDRPGCVHRSFYASTDSATVYLPMHRPCIHRQFLYICTTIVHVNDSTQAANWRLLPVLCKSQYFADCSPSSSLSVLNEQLWRHTALFARKADCRMKDRRQTPDTHSYHSPKKTYLQSPNHPAPAHMPERHLPAARGLAPGQPWASPLLCSRSSGTVTTCSGHMHLYIYICTHVDTSIHTCTCIFVYVYMYIYRHLHVSVHCTYIYIYICMYGYYEPHVALLHKVPSRATRLKHICKLSLGLLNLGSYAGSGHDPRPVAKKQIANEIPLPPWHLAIESKALGIWDLFKFSSSYDGASP